MTSEAECSRGDAARRAAAGAAGGGAADAAGAAGDAVGAASDVGDGDDPDDAVTAREVLARELGGWLADGLVSAETHALLRRRYQARAVGLGQALQYVGIAGGVLAFFGLIGLVSAMAGSALVAAVLFGGAGAVVTRVGLGLAGDAHDRYRSSSKVVLALGVVTSVIAAGLAVSEVTHSEAALLWGTGLLVVPAVLALAYLRRNLFLLVLALLAAFHWVGTSSSMFGRGGYALEIQDPRWMCGAALAAVALGVLHQVRWREHTGRFYQAYEVTGLVYLNLSLLILTIDDGRHGAPLVWIAVWAVAGLAQLVAGARLHDGVLTGFGVTALVVNLYTRYFETFWSRWHLGWLMLAGGLSLLAAGAACEVALLRARGRA